MQPPWWQRRWTALSRRTRGGAVAVVVLLVLGVGGWELRDRAGERALAQRVDLTASMGVSSLSTTPPGGQVSFFLVVRNEGVLPVRVASVEGSAGGLVLRGSDDVQRQVAPDGEAAVPVSVRLTCEQYAGGGDLIAEVTARRQDGAAVARQVRPDPADALLDVAATLCAVRPDVVDQELSGPVLDGLMDGGTNG